MRVGIVGLGKMGSAFAENLITRGYQVRVWDRSSDRTEPLVALGADPAATPEELVRGMDAVLVMLWDDVAAKEISLARIIPVASPPTIVIEMSTLSPIMYQTLGRAADRKVSTSSHAPSSEASILRAAGSSPSSRAVRKRRFGMLESFSSRLVVRSRTLGRPVLAASSSSRTTRSSAS